MKAHDVRHLCLCPKCGGIGDGREMIVVKLHGACAYEAFNERILSLPESEKNKFAIGDMPKALLMRLIGRSKKP